MALFHCVERQRLDRAVRRNGRRDIDQRGEPAECRDGARDRVLCARLIRHIDRERLRTAAAVGDSARHGFRFGRIEIGDGDLGALRREASRDRTADLAAAAGDQRDASRQPARRRHQLVACLYETAVENRRFGRVRLLDEADLDEPLRHFLVDRVRHVAVETEQFQLGDLDTRRPRRDPCGPAWRTSPGYRSPAACGPDHRASVRHACSCARTPSRRRGSSRPRACSRPRP